jgi:Flp pilus assembly protein TadD
LSYDMQPLRTWAQAGARRCASLWQRRPSTLRSFEELRRLSVNLFVMFVVGVLAWVTAEATFESTIIVEPISVPKSMEEEGFTGVAIAHALIDEIQRMSKEAKTTKRLIQFGSESRFAEASAISIPASSLNLHSLVSLLRQAVGVSSRQVTGEIIKAKDASANGARYSLRLHLVSGSSRESIIVQSADLEEVVGSGAQAIAERFNAYVLAFYLYGLRTRPDKAKLDDLLARIVAIGDPKDLPWAKTLQGLQLQYTSVDEATEKFREAIEIDPRYSGAYLSWGNMLAERGDKTAIEKFQAIIKLDPGDPTPYNNWGYVLDRSGDHTGAIEKFRKALELDPRYAKAYLNWGFALYNNKDSEGAIQKTRKAIELDPKESRAYSNLGFLLNLKQEYTAAIERCAKAVELKPGNGDAYFNWGNALRGLGDQNGAIDKYRKVVDLDRKYKAAYDNWAAALKSLGKTAEADAVLEDAKKAGAK